MESENQLLFVTNYDIQMEKITRKLAETFKDLNEMCLMQIQQIKSHNEPGDIKVETLSKKDFSRECIEDEPQLEIEKQESEKKEKKTKKIKKELIKLEAEESKKLRGDLDLSEL